MKKEKNVVSESSETNEDSPVLKIKKDNENTISFGVTINGSDIPNTSVKLYVEKKDYSLVYEGEYKDETAKFFVKWDDALDECKKFRLQVLVGDRFFNALDGEVKIEEDIKVSAKIKSEGKKESEIKVEKIIEEPVHEEKEKIEIQIKNTIISETKEIKKPVKKEQPEARQETQEEKFRRIKAEINEAKRKEASSNDSNAGDPKEKFVKITKDKFLESLRKGFK